ncbi:MaoC family dehydratase (plasmid) [Halococcus dombrowskii]|uniref:MaoC family dehydratase n=1 Tax=Halococcus dombrowskii TaxID=179637 RepID=A0AAV3SGR8_HALDO|nr:MaoC family dehydratase [Halococcus dombrowskii]UOO96951.1 MaoC family dehydratase [Halococcus dombrowskii]
MSKRYFEDIELGETLKMGTYTVSKEEILDFAEQYDPQPFHVDPEAAAQSPFGELIASGLHTMAITQRLSVDGLYNDAHGLGSPGLGETEFREPVHPDDELTVTLEPVRKRPLESRPNAGLVEFESHTRNQDDEIVLSMVAKVLFQRQDSS